MEVSLALHNQRTMGPDISSFTSLGLTGKMRLCYILLFLIFSTQTKLLFLRKPVIRQSPKLQWKLSFARITKPLLNSVLKFMSSKIPSSRDIYVCEF